MQLSARSYHTTLGLSVRATYATLLTLAPLYTPTPTCLLTAPSTPSDLLRLLFRPSPVRAVAVEGNRGVSGPLPATGTPPRRRCRPGAASSNNPTASCHRSAPARASIVSALARAPSSSAARARGGVDVGVGGAVPGRGPTGRRGWSSVCCGIPTESTAARDDC